METTNELRTKVKELERQRDLLFDRHKKAVDEIEKMLATIAAKDHEIKGLKIARNLFFDLYIRIWDDNFGCFKTIFNMISDEKQKKEWGTSLLFMCFPEYFRNKDVLTLEDGEMLKGVLEEMKKERSKGEDT